MDDETRVQYEGYRAGMYIRLEVGFEIDCSLIWGYKNVAVCLNESREMYHHIVRPGSHMSPILCINNCRQPSRRRRLR